MLTLQDFETTVVGVGVLVAPGGVGVPVLVAPGGVGVFVLVGPPPPVGLGPGVEVEETTPGPQQVAELQFVGILLPQFPHASGGPQLSLELQIGAVSQLPPSHGRIRPIYCGLQTRLLFESNVGVQPVNSSILKLP